MMYHSKYQLGFSLIELMVVMAIMSVLMGLTGGVIVKNVAQQTRLVELEKTQHYFKLLSYKAYYSGIPILITTEGHTLTITEHGTITQIEFEQLEFVKSEFNIQTTATILPNTFEVMWDEKNKEFEIDAMFKPYESK
ncbi:PulJ/GspJ family protein [Pseudoalteromonas tunicata]|uniref:PulJ/GspJ family protein n=1 Tax=Pseudoalteromonas tunicata TaxID=314281 RepID=UPI00273E42E7|nr:type II secretion system protein [Pseudoalteromonas tunicata]MDP4985456.1 type II secretion system GspH family protein [Pseudoalteromonas tunicata]MDP5213568.1 type II secretion system protein [Pseudoalteromonas tunicata]